MVYYANVAKRIGNVVRLAEVLQVLVKHGFANLVRYSRLHEGLPAKLLRGLHILEEPEGPPHTRGRRLRAVLTELGPTFIKFGQILSTRPDLIGQDLCNELGYLQDRVELTGFEEMRPVIEESLGAPLETLFKDFNPEPVASASLSQVYCAWTNDGVKVAVKVQRPGIREIIESDLSLMEGIADWLNEHVEDVQWMNPPGMVKEFSRSIRRELNFQLEARIIERFGESYKDDPDVFVPAVYHTQTSRQILTMDWIDGERIDALDMYPEYGCDPHKVAAAGCATICKQVFVFRLFHADPHPGNIRVLPGNRIAFLDYGMAGHLERVDVLALADLMQGIVQEDARRCTHALLAFTPSRDSESPEILLHEVADFIAFEAQPLVNKGEFARVIDILTNILRENRLELAPRFSLLLKALSTIENTAHKLDPSMDMLAIIGPFTRQAAASRYGLGTLAQEAPKNMLELMYVLRGLPDDLQALMRQFRYGRFRVQLHHEELNHVAHVADRASNRISFALVIGALIIGSSLLIAADVVPRSLGLAGYTVAGILGFGLAFSILRSRNY